SKLSLYYTNTDTSQHVDFVISALSARVNKFTHDYAASQITFEDSIQGGMVSYVQSMGGVKTKINLPHLAKLRELGPIAINKAELIITIVNGSDITYDPLDRFVLLASDSAGKNVVLPDQISSITSSFFGGEYNPSTNEYKFNIPRYTQQIVNGTRDNYGLFLLASGAASNANRSIIYGGNGQPPMRLRITYTRIQ
ncbi:MAG: DUF4270 family protein, partial [Bacteroidia bacterium]